MKLFRQMTPIILYGAEGRYCKFLKLYNRLLTKVKAHMSVSNIFSMYHMYMWQKIAGAVCAEKTR